MSHKRGIETLAATRCSPGRTAPGGLSSSDRRSCTSRWETTEISAGGLDRPRRPSERRAARARTGVANEAVRARTPPDRCELIALSRSLPYPRLRFSWYRAALTSVLQVCIRMIMRTPPRMALSAGADIPEA